MSLEIDELLDDLTLEETAMITASLEDVIIDEEIKNRLSSKALSKAGIDPEKVTVIPKTKPYHRWTKVVASIAALLIVCSATAYASGALEKLSGYFSGEVNPYMRQLLDTIQTSRDCNYKVVINGAMADKNQCVFAFSIYKETENGESTALLDDGLDETRYVSIYAKMKDGTKKEVQLHGISSSGDPNTCIYDIYREQLEIESMEQVEEFEVHYRDIVVNAKVTIIGKTLSLSAKKTASINHVEMSPIGFRFFTKDEDCEEELIDDIYDIKLIKKDGSLEKLVNFSLGEQTLNSGADGGSWLQGNYGGEILNLEEYQGLQIEGINYYKK